MKKWILVLAVFVVIGGSGITSYAAPEVVYDVDCGYVVFDPWYFADQVTPDYLMMYGMMDGSGTLLVDAQTVYGLYLKYCQEDGYVDLVDYYTPSVGDRVVPVFIDEYSFIYVSAFPEAVLAELAKGPTGERDWDSHVQNFIYGSEDLFRKDDGSGLIDTDGNGIDDRDIINGLGFIDLNFNSKDDRVEQYILAQTIMGVNNMSYLSEAEKQQYIQFETERLTKSSLICEHGILSSQPGIWGGGGEGGFATMNGMACKQCYPW